MRVLVTGAGAVLGQGIIRSLRASTLSATVIAVDPSPLSAGLYWADESYLIPMAADPAFASSVAALIERTRPDVVIPGTDVELLVFAKHRSEWEERYATKIVVSDPGVVAIADDKYETFRFLSANGFPAPASCLPGEEQELIARVGFPLIVKPRVGARSIGVVKVEDELELERVLLGSAGMVIQECVATTGDEYTAGALVFDGICRASIVMRRELRDGNTHRAFVDAYPDLNARVREMAELLAPHGPVNFQFRLDRQGHAKVFEINARFSGTTPFRARAGFNEVELVIRHIVHGEAIHQPTIEPMTILRHFEETVVRPGAAVR